MGSIHSQSKNNSEKLGILSFSLSPNIMFKYQTVNAAALMTTSRIGDPKARLSQIVSWKDFLTLFVILLDFFAILSINLGSLDKVI